MVTESIRIGDEYYLLASALAPRRPQVLLNHADSFAIFDLGGDIPLARDEPYGLFHRGTRFLDHFELRLNRSFPILLNTALAPDGSEILTYVTNGDEKLGDEIILQRNTVAVQRSKTLWGGALYERLHLQHCGQQPLQVEIEILFGTDFADVFELRGTKRSRRGELEEAAIERGVIRLPYRGLDRVRRTTVLQFSPAPEALRASHAGFRFHLAPGHDATVQVQVECRIDGQRAPDRTFTSALAELHTERSHWCNQFPRFCSDNGDFNAWLNRSLQDLALLHTEGEHGAYLYAGIPWFATIFGRDGLITALETLAFAPDLAAETLRTLAALQGRRHEPERDEEPGKILHELRHGEMAATGEIPFGQYYGSVDATPLFLLLLAEYTGRTGDLALARALWPNALAAMQWIEMRTGSDSRGYLCYARRSTSGLINQGWKDSHDAIFHEDGTLAEPPIALAEVQAYVYAARLGMADLARRFGYMPEAERWAAAASALQERFDQDFWMDEEDCYALALDGDQRPCRVITSNAGQCLFTGVTKESKAPRLISRCLREDMFCGWGIRTVSALARRYNPISYHNGSVWPHDNALMALGFARWGASDRAGQVLSALLNAATTMDDRRLPELFCGFSRTRHHGPVPYPVACKPQAWSAGSVFLLLQAALGLSVDGWRGAIIFDRMALPQGIDRLEIRGVQIRDARVDLTINRGRGGVTLERVDTRGGDVEIIVRQ
jgi:glycogen debranching enzyme